MNYALLLWDELAPFMDPWALSMVRTKQLVVEGIPDPFPDVRTESFDDGSYTIVMPAGFVDFTYAFARVLGALQRMHGPGETIEPALTRPQGIIELQSVFDAFRTQRRVVHGSFPIHPRQKDFSNEAATCAELFVLAHELGHVALSTGHWPASPRSVEIDADAFSVQLLVRAGEKLGHRMLLAGAFFAMRVQALIEDLAASAPNAKKVHLSPSHPSAQSRIQSMLDAARASFGDDGRFHEKLTMAVAYDEFVESLENEALGRGVDTVQTPIRVRVRIRAILEEAARGRLEPGRLPHELIAAFRGVPEVLVHEEVGAMVEEYRRSGAPKLHTAALAALRGALAGLPQPLQALVQGAIDG